MKKQHYMFLIIMIVSFSLSTMAEAARWEFLEDWPNDTTYIDADSISGDPNGPKEAWVKTVYKTPDCNSGLAKMLRKCIIIDLDHQRYYRDKSVCTLQSNLYFSDGTNRTIISPCEPIKVPPESSGEIQWKYIYK